MKPDTAQTCSADLSFRQIWARPTYQNWVECSRPLRVNKSVVAQAREFVFQTKLMEAKEQASIHSKTAFQDLSDTPGPAGTTLSVLIIFGCVQLAYSAWLFRPSLPPSALSRVQSICQC